MALNLTKLIFQRNIFNNNNVLKLIIKSFNGKLINNGIRLISIKVVKPCPEPNEDHDEKNARLKRVQSPHLSIYKPQITSFLSLIHRATGITVVVYSCILGLGAIILPHDFQYYLDMVESWELHPIILLGIRFIAAFPLVYHYLNGIRHLSWDAGRFLKIKQVYLTGYIVVAIAFAVTIGLSTML